MINVSDGEDEILWNLMKFDDIESFTIIPELQRHQSSKVNKLKPSSNFLLKNLFTT